MDQIQDQIDPEVAQEVIALLNKKITNLRRENAQLQRDLSRSSVKVEDGHHEASGDNTRRLLEKIEHLKSELQRRPGLEEVASLEKKLEKSDRRNRELEERMVSLNARLEESESERRTTTAVKEALENEIEKLCHTLNEISREKEEAIAKLELGPPADAFDFRKFLDGSLIELPQKRRPTIMTEDEKARFKDVIAQRGEELFSTDSPNGILWADQGEGCVVPLPSVLYNGRTQTTERVRRKPVENRLYQLCVVDKTGHCHTYYHGVYRCIGVITADWEQLVSLDKVLGERFLGRVVAEKSFVPPVFMSFFRQLYKTGALKIDCVVLRYERSDAATVKQVQSAEILTTTNVPSSQSGGKRPRDQNQERAGGPSKKPKFKK